VENGIIIVYVQSSRSKMSQMQGTEERAAEHTFLGMWAAQQRRQHSRWAFFSV